MSAAGADVAVGSAAGTFSVAPSEDGLRLDAFLVGRGLFASATAARRWLTGADARVRVAGKPARKGEPVFAGQVVEVSGLPSGPVLVPVGGQALVVVHEEEDFVVVIKPAGMPSHPLRPGESGSLAAALVDRFPECAAASDDPREGGLVHRLDTGTSGLLVAARSPEAFRALRASLASGSEKHYLAEVVGHPGQLGATLIVDQPIGRLGRRGGRVVVGGGRGALPARTEVVIRAQRAETSLIEARLKTGRAHQVRAHLAFIDAPILGDPVYGSPRAEAGFHLHAWRLWLRHPADGEVRFFEAPPPIWARIQ